MAERSLKKNCGDLRVALVRPSIIVSSYDEPCRGWTDTLAAGGGLTFAIQMGLIHRVKTTFEQIIDLIPCDFVSNMVIANTVYTAREKQPTLNIVHASTSSKNPFTIFGFRKYILQYGRYHEYLR